jgi:hypothetical protein
MIEKQNAETEKLREELKIVSLNKWVVIQICIMEFRFAII